MTKVPTLKALSEYQYCQYTSFCTVLFMKAKKKQKTKCENVDQNEGVLIHILFYLFFYFVVNFISFIPLFFGVPKFTY